MSRGDHKQSKQRLERPADGNVQLAQVEKMIEATLAAIEGLQTAKSLLAEVADELRKQH